MRGQIWSTDLIISAVIFFIAFTLLLFAWNFTSTQASLQSELGGLQSAALSISDALIRVPGVPQDWSAGNVQVIGLASEEGVLNGTKVDQFVNISYGITKSLLGIADSEFFFELSYPNGTVVQNQYGQDLTAGLYPASASLVVPVERHVQHNGNLVKMEFILWS